MQGERNDIGRDEAAAAARLAFWVWVSETGGEVAVVNLCSRLCEAHGAAPLTPEEVEERVACREQFGVFDPTQLGQAALIGRIRQRRSAAGDTVSF
jgi:hypothetical protein